MTYLGDLINSTFSVNQQHDAIVKKLMQSWVSIMQTAARIRETCEALFCMSDLSVKLIVTIWKVVKGGKFLGSKVPGC